MFQLPWVYRSGKDFHRTGAWWQNSHGNSEGLSQKEKKSIRDSRKHWKTLPAHHSFTRPLSVCLLSNRQIVCNDNSISHVHHSTISHKATRKENYAHQLFIDYSSAFSATAPFRLVNKINKLGLSSLLYLWVLMLLTHRQVIKTGQHFSSSITHNSSIPQGYVISPSPFTPMTAHLDNVKFAADTLVILISHSNCVTYVENREVL